jgi:hypothetical protein
MNTDHVINGWVAQLSVDARRGDAQRTIRAPQTAVAPVALVSAAPTEPVLPAAPIRTRGRLLPVRARGRDGSSRRGVGQPCLSVA